MPGGTHRLEPLHALIDLPRCRRLHTGAIHIRDVKRQHTRLRAPTLAVCHTATDTYEWPGTARAITKRTTGSTRYLSQQACIHWSLPK